MPFYFIGTRSFYINKIKAKQMKVFAQFIDIDSFISIRKNTILQFGALCMLLSGEYFNHFFFLGKDMSECAVGKRRDLPPSMDNLSCG